MSANNDQQTGNAYKPGMANGDMLLDHLGDYIQEPFDLLGSYFDGKPLERLTRHQLESYNQFVTYQMQRTINMFNPIVIHSDNDFNEETNEY